MDIEQRLRENIVVDAFAAGVIVSGQLADRLIRERLDAADELKRLRKGIQDYLDGNYPQAAKNDKCSHGRYGFEGCENCIDEHFAAVLSGKRIVRST